MHRCRTSSRSRDHEGATALPTLLLTIVVVAGCYPRAETQEGDRAELLNRVTNAYPAYSPDGLWIAYMSNADGDFDVYAVSPTLGLRRQLTGAPDRDGTPAWSPDGGRVAFQSFLDGHSQIYVMNADGTEQRNLSNNRWSDEHPFWSADGERLLSASNRSATPEAPDNIDIFETRVDGGGVRMITHTPEVETYPSWSPDGGRIAMRRILADGDWEVVVTDADGGNPRLPAPHPASTGGPCGRRTESAWCSRPSAPARPTSTS